MVSVLVSLRVLRVGCQPHRVLGLIESALSEAAKEIFRMMPEAPKFFSESQRRSFDKGVVQGKAEGKAEGRRRRCSWS